MVQLIDTRKNIFLLTSFSFDENYTASW